jgi:hypothetical protein
MGITLWVLEVEIRRTYSCARQEVMWESEVVASLIFNLGTRW